MGTPDLPSRLTLLAAVLAPIACAGACATHQHPQLQPSPPGIFPILQAVGPTPTGALLKVARREDIEVRPTNFEVTPAVVATGVSPPFVLGPQTRVSFAGDAAGTKGWRVDNVLLVEVLDTEDKVLDAFVIGFLTGRVYQGHELLENVGAWSPNFDPRSPDLSLRLPRGERIKLRVTALDNGNVGSVSDLFLVIEETKMEHHDLRDPFWGG
jgi:hypothetical protein